MKCVLGLALVVVCLTASDLYSGTLEVCPTGCAYSTIQDAVAAASNGDEIVVAPGTYTSTQDGHVVNMPDQAVTLRSSDPTNPSVVNSTIIDGQNARRGLYCDSTTSTNTIIEGFTFVNGLGNSDGGGMLLDASITVRNCVFQNNSAGYAGGGLRISNCSASIEQCEFRNNTAVWGGGMSIAGAEANPSVADCRFVANQSQEGGCGGAVSAWLCNAVFDRCIFEDNLSNCGAAIFMATQGDAY